MRFCFDLDGTLCIGKPYTYAKPIWKRIEMVRKLKKAGHTIIISTARGMSTYEGNVGACVAAYGAMTCKQLEEWGVSYDEMHFGKPGADVYVDDKALNTLDWSSLEEYLR